MVEYIWAEVLKLVESMPRRLKAIMDNKGLYKKY